MRTRAENSGSRDAGDRSAGGARGRSGTPDRGPTTRYGEPLNRRTAPNRGNRAGAGGRVRIPAHWWSDYGNPGRWEMTTAELRALEERERRIRRGQSPDAARHPIGEHPTRDGG